MARGGRVVCPRGFSLNGRDVLRDDRKNAAEQNLRLADGEKKNVGRTNYINDEPFLLKYLPGRIKRASGFS